MKLMTSRFSTKQMILFFLCKPQRLIPFAPQLPMTSLTKKKIGWLGRLMRLCRWEWQELLSGGVRARVSSFH
jgi:hypothetical protein